MAARNWVTLLAIGLIWGSSFILMKRGLTVFTDVQVAALRIGLAWLVTMPFLIPSLRDITRKQWGILLAVGLFGNGIPAFLFTAAQTHLDSSVVGMLNSLVPVLTVIFGALMFGLRVGGRQTIGILVGLAGALLLIMPQGISRFQWPALLVVAASSCYAFNLNIVRRHLQEVPTMIITAGAFLWVGPACIIYVMLSDFTVRLQHPGAALAFGSILLLATVGTALAVLIFNRLIQRAGPVFASTVTYVVPVFAVMWGILDGEQLLAAHVIGVATVLFGVYLINKSQ
ncbi:MAG: DMT family transporter [Flavobacteriales bacterium]|nr:DMT family transporter [Flavobacteriales bacterium]